RWSSPRGLRDRSCDRGDRVLCLGVRSAPEVTARTVVPRSGCPPSEYAGHCETCREPGRAGKRYTLLQPGSGRQEERARLTGAGSLRRKCSAMRTALEARFRGLRLVRTCPLGPLGDRTRVRQALGGLKAAVS